jgi:metallo-beta-lactamase class B
MNRFIAILFLFAASNAVDAYAQASKAQAHVRAAKALTGQPGLYNLTPTFDLLCTERKPRVEAPRTASGPANRGAARVPERSQWYVEPVKVFDNLYNVGTSYYVWAVTTSDGIILLNSGRDYAADAVVEGLQKMGLDPAAVKYIILHNADPAHYGAAKLFQDRYRSRVMLSEADWNVITKTPEVPAQLKPRKDMVVTDGQKLTLGDTTLTLYVTPGNTPGTLSTVVPLKDGNRQHAGLMIGGRDWDAAEQGVEYFPSEEVAIKTWIASANRLRDIAAKSNVDVFLSVRSLYDHEAEKPRVLKLRRPGDPHPYVNKSAVDRYLAIISECMNAQLAWRSGG